MKYLSYQKQLKHHKWKKFRAKLLQKKEYKCERCQSVDKPLVVHHIQYVKGRLAWEYHPDLLQVLCDDCHRIEHECKVCGDIGHKEENCPNKGALFYHCECCGKTDWVRKIADWLYGKVDCDEDRLFVEYFGGWRDDDLCYECTIDKLNEWNFFLEHKRQTKILFKQ